METAIAFRETSTIFSPIKKSDKWFVRNFVRTNYPRFEFDTSLIYSNLIVIDNSTMLESERKDILDEIKGAYEFSNIEEIRKFVLQNNYLVDILKEAPEDIYRIFGKSIKLVLELHSDPEEEWDELFIVIKSPYAPQKARELMNELDRMWFLNIMDKTQGKLCITEEYL